MGCLVTLLKIIFAPFILIFQAFWVYFVGCFIVYFERGFRGIFCGLCVCFHCTFKDKKFPANAQSIGKWENKSLQQIEQEIEWKRIGEICARGGQTGAKLFSGEVEPSDICQGQLGNCWLMSACACLATQEGAIQKVFNTKEVTGYGKYSVKLFDKPSGKFQKVVIDDWIPCSRKTGTTIFAKPNGDEAWVLLLEKAMAKFKGTYADLDGGSTLWALETLTGDYGFKFKAEGASWKRYELVHPKERNGAIMMQPTADVLTPDDMFATMLFYSRRKSVIGASSGGGSDTENVNGIVQGHAYTVTSVKEVNGFKMLQLRNPWGTFEWQGAWSDNSPLWQQNPKLARALDFKPTDDGTFWMEWKDFSQYYKNVDFCYRTTGWDDLTLDIHEECPCFGPTWGCIEGCFWYWLCCKGVRALFCAQKQKAYQKAEKGCCSCV